MKSAVTPPAVTPKFPDALVLAIPLSLFAVVAAFAYARKKKMS
jgi:hypothetical protein